jgi:hypothetical protein
MGASVNWEWKRLQQTFPPQHQQPETFFAHPLDPDFRRQKA